MNSTKYNTTRRNETSDFVEAQALTNMSASKALRMVEAQQARRERLLAEAMAFCN